MTAERLKDLYRRVLLVRMCELQISKEYFQDEMKTPVHLGIGGEAIACAVHAACPADSQYFGTYRNHALYLSCSDDTDGFFGEMYGKVNGCGKGKAGSMHMSCPEAGLIATSAVVATTIPVAAGAALASQYNGQNKLSVCMFGDGAVEEGVFFETMNFASLKKLPLLLVCEDNELAIHSLKHERKGFDNFADIAKAFDFEYASGDGTNAREVFTKTSDLLARMKDSGKPGFLHFSYFRFLEHVGPLEDFNKGYREKPDNFQQLDPLVKLKADCLNAGIQENELAEIQSQLTQQIEISVAKAKAAPFPSSAELSTDIYARSTKETH